MVGMGAHVLAHVLLDGLERRSHPIGVDASTLPNRAAAAAFAAGDLAERLNQVIGWEPISERAGHLDREILAADDDRDAIAIRPAERMIGEDQQVFFAVVDSLEQDPNAVYVGLLELGAPSSGQPLAESGGLLLEAFHLGLQGGHPGWKLRR